MYSPRLSDELIHQLWQLKQRTRIPMTKLLDQAVHNFLNSESVKQSDFETELKTDLKGQGKSVISS